MEDNLYEWLVKAMDPYKNKFTMTVGRNFNENSSKEIWIHGEVAAISIENPLDWVEAL